MRESTVHSVDDNQTGVFTMTVGAPAGQPWQPGEFFEHQPSRRLFSILSATEPDEDGMQIVSLTRYEA